MNTISKMLQYKISYLIAGIVLTLILNSLFSGGSHHHDTQTQTASSTTASVWTCAMHPQIRQPEPGPCPICGMDLIPVVSQDDDSGNPRVLTMSESAKKLAEIQTVSVKREYVEHELRLVGKIEYDETRLKYITAWFPGRLDRLYVDYTGTPVKTGDHLAEIYSPAILTDQEALLQAKQSAARSNGSTVNPALANRNQTLERARERLRLLGLTEQQIADIEEKGVASERVNFYSPMDGIVVDKMALEGGYVETGSRIFTIADLSHVWVKLDAYESDLQWIHYGQEVEFTSVSFPGEVFKGRVSFIDPFLNQQTRTVKVRINVDNHDGKLKPDMFVRAVVHSKVNAAGEIYDQMLAGKWICPMHPEIIKDETGVCDICGMPLVNAESLGYVDAEDKDHEPPLVIPASAPLITGKRAVVYVKVPDTDKPTFEGREIVLGPRLKDHYIVQSGLEEGEEVVVKGNFKIDSALQLQAKPSMMSPEGGVMTGGHQHGEITPQAQNQLPSIPVIPTEALQDLLSAYQPLHKALAADDLASAQTASNTWVEAAKKHGLQQIEMLGHGVMHAESIAAARMAFSTISTTLIDALHQQNPLEKTVYVVNCFMAFGDQDADWIQWDENVLNPYLGGKMPNCGVIKETMIPNQAGGQPSPQTESNLIHQH